MRIAIDVDLDKDGNVLATHYFEFGPTLPSTVSPLDKATMISSTAMLAALSSNAGLRDAAGWNVPTKLPGYPPGTTRYGVMVIESKKAGAHPLISALNLQP